MANITQSVADTSGFIPQAWANEALDVLRNNIVIAKLCARDSDFDDRGWVGKQLNIPYPGTFAAQDKTPGSLASVQAPSNGATVSVNLSKHKTVDFIIEDLAQATADVNLIQKYAQPAAIALAEQVESDLIGLYSSMTGATSGVVATDLTSAVVRQAQKNLDIAKAPRDDRFLLVSPKDMDALLGDSNLATYFAYSQAASIQDGKLGAPLYGFNVAMSQLAPSVSGGHSVQNISITGAPTGGTFTLTYSGQTTAAIAFNASAAAVESAIAALSNVGAGMVRVSGGPGPATAWNVVLFLASPAAFTHTDSLTGGTTPAVAVADSASAATINIAAHKNAVLLATRPFQDIPQGTGAQVAQAFDPMSGLSMRVSMQYQPQYRGIYVAFDILYGLVALRPNQGAVVLA